MLNADEKLQKEIDKDLITLNEVRNDGKTIHLYFNREIVNMTALFSEALQKVGSFDERFFMYSENIDFSRRMHAACKTMYYPKVTIVHAHKQASYKNRRMMRIHIGSTVKYFNKWGWFFDAERRRANRQCLSRLREKSF